MMRLHVSAAVYKWAPDCPAFLPAYCWVSHSLTGGVKKDVEGTRKTPCVPTPVLEARDENKLTENKDIGMSQLGKWHADRSQYFRSAMKLNATGHPDPTRGRAATPSQPHQVKHDTTIPKDMHEKVHCFHANKYMLVPFPFPLHLVSFLSQPLAICVERRTSRHGTATHELQY